MGKQNFLHSGGCKFMDLNQSDNCGNEGCLKLVNSEPTVFRSFGRSKINWPLSQAQEFTPTRYRLLNTNYLPFISDQSNLKADKSGTFFRSLFRSYS